MKKASLTIGIIVIIFLITWALLVWQKGENGQIFPPDGNGISPTGIQPSDGNNIEDPPQNGEIPAGWKTYRNEELGFQLAYPGEWFVYDKAKWEEDNRNERCVAGVGFVHLMNGILFSKKELGRCVDYYPGPHTSELAIRVIEGEVPNYVEEYYIEEPGREIITIGGIKALKLPTLNNTTLPQRDDVTTIGFNYKGKRYGIILSQVDREGHYDPILDEILSTFRFLD